MAVGGHCRQKLVILVLSSLELEEDNGDSLSNWCRATEMREELSPEMDELSEAGYQARKIQLAGGADDNSATRSSRQ